MRLSVGDKLGPYEILAPIGAGGMGEVYKARDTRLDRIVAIKVSREQFSERFEREARAVAALNHPHICQLYDVGPNYLVMEFIEGAPLKGPLPIEKAVEYASQILDALDAAHRKGITHRDLKPANILVTKQGIKLLDFGLAKQSAPLTEADATLTAALTGKGQIMGTLQYMSPEQLHGQEADPRSDLFSFGCVLYEMLTGKRAFEGRSAASVIAAILEREPAPLDVAPPLDRVVRRSLAKDPDQRFQTARDLKTALTWAMEQAPASAAAGPIRRWWIPAAAILIVGAIVGWGIARFRQPLADERAYRLQINPPEGGRFALSTTGGIAVSPDGRSVAYTSTANGKTAIWAQPLDGAARMLPGTEGGGNPFWSPDGKSVGFFTESKLLRVDVAGGAPSTICNTDTGRGGAWSSDGYIIFSRLSSGLFKVPASGGTPSTLTTLDRSRGEGFHFAPQFLPGGRFLYFTRADKPEDSGLYAASLAKPAERMQLLTTLTDALYAPSGDGKEYLLWLHETTLVAQEFDSAGLKLKGEPRPVADPVATTGVNSRMQAGVSANGLLVYHGEGFSKTQFTWLDRTGKPLGVLGEPDAYRSFRLSPDGRRVAVVRDRPGGRNDLWLLEVDRGVPSRFTISIAPNFPIWSPDGRTLLFQSCCPLGIFRKELDGSSEEQRLIGSGNAIYPEDWSRDGRLVLYRNVASTGRDMWTLPVTPEGKPAGDPKPYLRTSFNEGLGRFSPEPNPHWVAYESDESGQYEIYIQSFPEPRGKRRISTGGGRSPQWGPSGRELFYASLDGKLMVVSLKPTEDSLEPSSPRELFPVPSTEGANSAFDVSPDGQRILVRAQPHQSSPPLTVIVNWPALLRKGVAVQ